MFKRSDKKFILDMLIACEKIMKYTQNITYEDFYKNDMIVESWMARNCKNKR
jgi:uncharacterized protein with HEPN domain